MTDLSKILYPNKATGDTFSAAEVNEIKAKFNAVIDYLNGLATVTPPTTAPATNQGPNVAISLSSTSIVAGTNVTVTASATDIDGTISKIQILNGSTVIGEALTPNYSFLWQNVPVGNYSLSAKATDNAGAVGTSTSITLTATAPVVVVTNPPATTTPTNKPAFALVIGNSLQRDLGYLSDSRALNTDGPAPYFFRLLLESALGKQLVDYKTSAIYGQTTGNVLDNFSAQVETHVRNAQAANANVDVAVFFSEWINGGLNHGETPQNMYDNAVTLCNRTIALSTATSQVKFIIASPTDCDLGTAGNPTWKALADGVTSLLLANSANAPWYLANVRANTSIGVDGSALTHTYVRDDGGWYHLNALGYIEYANEYAKAFAQAYGLTIPNDISTFSVTVTGDIANLNTNAGRWVREHRIKSTNTWQRSPTFKGLAAGTYDFEARLVQKQSNSFTASGTVAAPTGGPVFKILSETDANPATGAAGVISLEFITGTIASGYEWARADGFTAITAWTTLTGNTFTVPVTNIPVNGLVFRPKNNDNSYTGAIYNSIMFHDPFPEVTLEILSYSATQLIVKTRTAKYDSLNLVMDNKFYPGDPNFLKITGPIGTYITTTWNMNPTLTPGQHVFGAYTPGQDYDPTPITFTI